MIDTSRLVFFVPGHLKRFKLDLFNRIGGKIEQLGGRVIRGDFAKLGRVEQHEIPIVGCTPELRPLINYWVETKQPWIYWDRGYARRVFATWLPKGSNGGYYRWHVGSFQTQRLRKAPGDRWATLDTKLEPWRKSGKHILIAAPSATYARFHEIPGWLDETLHKLSLLTDRPLMIRGKETRRPLQWDLDGCHALVTHGSIAAVEAAVLGTPVFVDRSSAAALVGQTDLAKIEIPMYPSREAWLHTLAYDQFDEQELVDGTLWRLIS